MNKGLCLMNTVSRAGAYGRQTFNTAEKSNEHPNKFVHRDFHSLYKVGRNGIIVFKGINNSKKKFPPVGHNLMQEIITSLRLQCLTN